jgi:transaldolase
MPEKTLRAFADHGHVEPTLDADVGGADTVLAAAAAEGVVLETITLELEREGVQAFCDAYDRLLSCIASKRDSLALR